MSNPKWAMAGKYSRVPNKRIDTLISKSFFPSRYAY